MPVPLEFLLGMKEPAEIDRRVLVPEQLRRGGLKCVRRGEGGRNPIGGVGADGVRKIGDTLGFDLEPHRRVQPAGDRSHVDAAKALWVGGARGRGVTASAAGSLRSPRLVPGVEPPPSGIVVPPVGSEQLLSRRHVAWGPAPRGMTLYTLRLSAVGSNGIQPYWGK